MQESFILEEDTGGREEVESQATHSEEEIIAQSVCTSMASNKGMVYAVRRFCHSNNKRTCVDVCTNDALRQKDPHTSSRGWTAVGALHVFKNRPVSTPGTLGLKVFRYSSVKTNGCGPNYCCCHVPF